MNKSEKYNLARWAMEHAIKKGAQQVSVSISDNKSSNIEVRDEKIDKLEQANRNNMRISLYVYKMYSAHSTNRLNNKAELARFIEEAIAGTKYLSEDEFRTLPDPALYYQGGKTALQTSDKDFNSVNPQQKIDYTFAIEKEILGMDERIISITSSYNDGLNGLVMVTSNGFEGDRENTSYALIASVSVKSGDARPRSYWYESSIFHNQLIKQGIGNTALERALQKLGQKKIKSGKMPMIVENRQTGNMVNPLISALNGYAIQQKNSFLIDMAGEKIGSDKLTVIDDPFIVSGRGSRLFDREGLATKKRTIFERGVLKDYYIDTYYGKKLNMDPTSGESTNLVIEPGEKNLQEMLASLDRGILVPGFNGGNSNGATGDFSYGIEGFLVENGILAKPVSEMNITGNFKQVWKDFVAAGNDVYEGSSLRTPSLQFDNIDFSGI